MVNTEFKISNLELSQWMNAIRNLETYEQRTRALDALWDGQLTSKGWLVNNLKDYLQQDSSSNIYIFGGWIGILASMILQSSDINVNKVRSIDLDPWCESIADTVNKIHEMNDWRFKSVTADMTTYKYQSDIAPHVVINTSTEHVTQEQYDKWYYNIPQGSLIVIQGNDYFSCDEHVRCSSNLSEFEIMNMVSNPMFSGELRTNMYTRFMSIWRK